MDEQVVERGSRYDKDCRGTKVTFPLKFTKVALLLITFDEAESTEFLNCSQSTVFFRTPDRKLSNLMWHTCYFERCTKAFELPNN